MNIWQSYKQERDCLVHFLSLNAECWPGAQFVMFAAVRRWFELVSRYCQAHSDLIPVAFILGFYVSIVVSRFWEQLNALPWLHRTAFFVASMIHRCDDRGRMLRRNIMRYLTVAYILTMKDICPPVRKRFPTLQRMRDLGTGS